MGEWTALHVTCVLTAADDTWPSRERGSRASMSPAWASSDWLERRLASSEREAACGLRDRSRETVSKAQRRLAA